jgi:hypothetical protein
MHYFITIKKGQETQPQRPLKPGLSIKPVARASALRTEWIILSSPWVIPFT